MAGVGKQLVYMMKHVLQTGTVFVRLHAHAQIASHTPLLSESMHSELGVFHVIFAFCDTLEVTNVE